MQVNTADRLQLRIARRGRRAPGVNTASAAEISLGRLMRFNLRQPPTGTDTA